MPEKDGGRAWVQREDFFAMPGVRGGAEAGEAKEKGLKIKEIWGNSHVVFPSDAGSEMETMRMIG